jgi:hypothetical protein
MSGDDTGSTGEKTFTQAELNAIVRDRLARESAKYADYDELKAKATEADKNKSQIDKMADQLSKLEQRAEQAEATNIRREVADELGLKPGELKRLTGKTREELLADGRELLSDLGTSAEERKKQRTDSASGSSSTSDNGGTDDNGSQDETDDSSTTSTAPKPRRTQETLRSGAPMSPGKPEETDPAKLAALIPRRG